VKIITHVVIIASYLLSSVSFCPAERRTVDHFSVLGPATVTAVCDEVLIRIDGPRAWTMSRIEYKGTILAIEESAYGTVFHLPEVGHIGSAHREVETEDVQVLEFFLDGKKISEPPAEVQGSEFKIFKKSQIRDLTFESVVRLEKNRIYETVFLSATKDVPLTYLYNFMHPWIATTTAFLSAKSDGTEIAGDLKDGQEYNRKFYICQEVEWMAIYDAATGKGAVSRLLEKPPIGGAETRLWNCVGVYRKFYLRSFESQTVPAHFRGTYRMVTGFFEANKQQWPEAARKLAREISEP